MRLEVAAVKNTMKVSKCLCSISAYILLWSGNKFLQSDTDLRFTFPVSLNQRDLKTYKWDHTHSSLFLISFKNSK